MIRTYNIELLPDDATREYWTRLLSDMRDVFNRAVTIIAESGCHLSVVPVHAVCYDTLRAEFPGVPSQSVIRTQREVAAMLKSRKSNRHHGSLPKKHALCLPLDKRLYGTLDVRGITLNGGTRGKRVLVPFRMYDRAEELFLSCVAKDPKIVLRDDRLFLSVPFEVPERPVNGDTAVGVDLGERQFFVTSEGKAFSDKGFLARRRRVRHNKRVLQSRGTKSARRHLRRVRRHEANMTKDMCRRAANVLLASTDAHIVVMENLKRLKTSTSRTKDGHRRKDHNRRMAQVPFALFKEVVTQKAQSLGKRVETVAAAYTSQTDSRTGRRDGERIGRRYVCSDGVVLDADWNAAVNIALRSKHPVSSATPYDGGLTPLTGRAQSTDPSHCKPTRGLRPRGLASR